ncbi:MAG: Xaa-Pro peptidase family protein [Armatimonadota bacterium]|nr:Xaa-Pro peptidase family protein [Armatimonadota bacterium]MDR7450610.1 Xaa-Pro peptidase family protein [Armatimonadota bacterium]MDR7466257.1 Xaa-Pro peptidase family protein [Armatimonadota bacterium]MDR7492978.1 Xaa-Pro peptidase family protein [Armatimonadota bacterium]MDR7498265.1 Xaa-Pro peptidase family protein [Armatimonadota bacterium]
MRSWAPGAFGVDYEQRVEFSRLRAGRLNRVREQMRRRELDALLVWKDENVRYLTGLRPQLIAGKSGLLNGALLLPAGDPILFVSGGDADRAAQGMPWIAEFYPIPILEEQGLIDHVVAVILGGVLRRHGLQAARIGLDLAPQAMHDALRARHPGVRWVDGDAAMQAARLIKLPEELALVEEAVAIAEAVTQAAVEAVRPGRRECDVAAEAMQALYRLGGEYAHVITPFVASGERMSPPTRLATDKVIRHGDLVFIDIGAMWNGYFADLGRTVICGTPSAEQRRIYRAVHAAQQAGIEAMRPGATTGQVAAAVRQAAVGHGLAERFLNLFIGHGIGAGANEPPYVGEVFPGAAEVELQPGMLFALEPLIWVPGVPGGGGVRLEDMVLVAEDGPRRLSRLPYDRRLLETHD